MAALIQGRIVYALDPISDPQGKNPKSHRPFVVISTPEEIKGGGPIDAVAISHSFRGGDDEVELPFGHFSSLPDRSVAVCSWRVQLEQSRISVPSRHVRPRDLRAILDKIDELDARDC